MTNYSLRLRSIAITISLGAVDQQSQWSRSFNA